MLRLSFFFLIATAPLSALDQGTSTAEEILKNWAAKGMDINASSVGEGTQNLIVFAQEGFTLENGYFPLKTTAQAGKKSILRVYTNRTMGCSQTFNLPDFHLSAMLPSTGVEEFEIPPMEKGSHLKGVCDMGIYTFDIVFN